MRKLKSIFISILVTFMIVSASACVLAPQEVEKGKTPLKISFFKAGYGDDWLKALEKQFELENPTVDVLLDGNYTMEDIVKTDLETMTPKSNVSDIYTVCSANNYRDFIRKGYLEKMTDLYDTVIEDDTKLKDIVDPNILDYTKSGEDYYCVPWTGATTGIVYNKKMFNDNNWTIPTTVKELMQLCEKIDKSGVTKPFVYPGGTSEGYWPHIMNSWFAQYEGEESFKEFMSFPNAEVYKKEGRKLAYQAVGDLIGVKDTRNYILTGSRSFDHLAAQREFIKGSAAMVPGGSWMKTEMKAFLKDFPEFEMAFMPLPSITDNKLDKNGKPIKSANSASADGFIIPKYAKQKELAKKFLAFSSRQDMLNVFVEQTGGNPRPFIMKEKNWDNLDSFGKSAMQIWQDSFNIFPYSNAEIFIKGEASMFIANNGAPISAFNVPTIKSQAQVDEKVLELFNDDYKIMAKRFELYK